MPIAESQQPYPKSMYPAAFLRFDFAIAGLPACCCLRFHMVSRCGVVSTSNLVEQIIPLKLPITNIFKYDVLQWNTVFWNEIRSFEMKYEVLEWNAKFWNEIYCFGIKEIRSFGVKYHVWEWHTKFWIEIHFFGMKYEVLELNTKFWNDLALLTSNLVGKMPIL